MNEMKKILNEFDYFKQKFTIVKHIFQRNRHYIFSRPFQIFLERLSIFSPS